VSAVFEQIAPRLLGPALAVALALLVKGYGDVGDGFSAGVIVALAIALRYLVLGVEEAERTLPVLRHAPAATVGGLLLALLVGFAPVAFGDPPFTHTPGPGASVVHVGTVELITPVLFDVGVLLLVTGALVMVIHQFAHLVRSAQP
jgi:multicomponent Na+:H+ antiporter subunit B